MIASRAPLRGSPNNRVLQNSSCKRHKNTSARRNDGLNDVCTCLHTQSLCRKIRSRRASSPREYVCGFCNCPSSKTLWYTRDICTGFHSYATASVVDGSQSQQKGGCKRCTVKKSHHMLIQIAEKTVKIVSKR